MKSASKINQKASGVFHPILAKPKVHVWYQVDMDIIGPMPENKVHARDT